MANTSGCRCQRLCCRLPPVPARLRAREVQGETELGPVCLEEMGGSSRFLFIMMIVTRVSSFPPSPTNTPGFSDRSEQIVSRGVASAFEAGKCRFPHASRAARRARGCGGREAPRASRRSQAHARRLGAGGSASALFSAGGRRRMRTPRRGGAGGQTGGVGAGEGVGES